jgi:hypothetical protein
LLSSFDHPLHPNAQLGFRVSSKCNDHCQISCGSMTQNPQQPAKGML